MTVVRGRGEHFLEGSGGEREGLDGVPLLHSEVNESRPSCEEKDDTRMRRGAGVWAPPHNKSIWSTPRTKRETGAVREHRRSVLTQPPYKQ